MFSKRKEKYWKDSIFKILEKGDILDFLKKNKHLCPILIYGIFYFAAFIFLENTNEKIHIIHMRFDDCIPFCEYFIVPYVM